MFAVKASMAKPQRVLTPPALVLACGVASSAHCFG